MICEDVLSGYYGLFQPPYSILNPQSGGCLYTIATEYRDVLVIIPLIPHFFLDVVKIMKRLPVREILFVVPDFGIRYVSDYVNSWYFIKKKMNIPCHFFAKYLPEGTVSQEFLADIIRNNSDAYSFAMYRNRANVSTINIQLTKFLVNTAAPWACDVIVSDTTGRKYFSTEMNEEKLKRLNQTKEAYHEIHMPFILGQYQTMSYDEAIRNFPGLINQLRVNQFSTYEELQSALTRGIHCGKVVSL